MAKVVAVQGCRHGIGSSNLTANLAATLTQQQRRVGLIDTDLQVPALHLLFGLSEATVADESNACFGGTILEPEVNALSPSIHALSLEVLPQQDLGIYFLSRSRSLTAVAKHLGEIYNINTAPRGLHSVASELALDYLLIDAQPNLDEEALNCFTITDVLLVLVGLEAYDLQRAAVMIEVARSLGVPQIFLVPSCVLSDMSSQSVYDELQTAFDAEVAGILPFSEEIVGLASNGVFVLHYPDHRLTQAVQTIATHIQIPPPLILATAKDDTLSALLAAGSDLSRPQRSLFHVLDLPTRQRQVVAHVLRHGAATASELRQALGLSLTVVNATLVDLVEIGWLQPKRQAGNTQYQLQTQSNQSSRVEEGDKSNDRE